MPLKFRAVARALILVAFVGLAIWFFASGASETLTFQALKENQADLEAIYNLKPVWMLSAYGLVYLLMAAVSLPGATVLTLAGGAIFGLWPAIAIVSFASTFGATLAFWSSRFVFRDFIERHFRDRFKVINAGVEAEGWRYLLTLRLVPLFPFFVVNLAMGLTRMRTLPFFVVSQIGMLPGTFLYVNAGTRLGEVESPDDIMTLGFALSFAALGAFPWLAKRVAKYF